MKPIIKYLLVTICIIMIGIYFGYKLFSFKESKNDKEINILNWSSYIPDSVLKDFENETGIKVNYATYSSNEELLAKLSSSKKGTYDLIFPSDYMVELMISRELIQKIDLSEIKNVKNLNSTYLNPEYDKNNKYTLPFLATITVIAYNTDFIKENITGYNDLLNPKYKGEIVLIDDERIIIGMALQALGYEMNEIDESKLNEAKEWLLKLKKNIKAYDSDSPKLFLISNEASIGVVWNAEAALAMAENSKIKTVFPKDGYAISVDNYAIPVESKNKQNAYEFINYLLKGDVMAKIIKDYPYKNLNIQSEKYLDDSYLNNYAANIEDDIMRKGTFVKNIDKKIIIYDKVWAQLK